MSTCSNAAGQPYGSAKPDTYLKAQLDKITKPLQDRAAAAQAIASASTDPLNTSGRGQLLNIVA